MSISELIEALQDMGRAHGDDRPVFVAVGADFERVDELLGNGYRIVICTEADGV